MKLAIKKSDGIGFARKEAYEYNDVEYEADIQNGDEVEILDGGESEVGQYGEQTYFKIQTRNGIKKMPFNQASINVLIEEFDDETEAWIGKKVKVLTKKDKIAGKKVIIAYLVTAGWSLDEYGGLEKTGVATTPLTPPIGSGVAGPVPPPTAEAGAQTLTPPPAPVAPTTEHPIPTDM